MKHERGAALLEFAMALPFALTLFVGIGDFTVYFWRQTQMEETARGIHRTIGEALEGYAEADGASLERYSQTLQDTARRQSGIENLTVQLSRHYACPLAGGGEESLTGEPRRCAGERIYLRVVTDQPMAPLLAPLRNLGYPRTAFSRHVLRLR